MSINNATVNGNVSATDTYSFLTLSSLVKGSASVSNYANLNLNTGSSVASLAVSGNSGTATLDGGAVDGATTVQAYGNLLVNSGSLHSLQLSGNSHTTLAGGAATDTTSQDDATLTGSPYLVLHSGSIGGNLTASNFSSIDIESQAGLAAIGGTISLHDHSFLLVNGIPVNPDVVAASDILATPAALSSTPIYLYDNTTLEIDGLNLSATLLDPNQDGQFSEYQLTGTLQDGTPPLSNILLYVQNGSAASYNLINLPEPSLLAACGLTLPLFLRRRKSNIAR